MVRGPQPQHPVSGITSTQRRRHNRTSRFRERSKPTCDLDDPHEEVEERPSAAIAATDTTTASAAATTARPREKPISAHHTVPTRHLLIPSPEPTLTNRNPNPPDRQLAISAETYQRHPCRTTRATQFESTKASRHRHRDHRATPPKHPSSPATQSPSHRPTLPFASKPPPPVDSPDSPKPTRSMRRRSGRRTRGTAWKHAPNPAPPAARWRDCRTTPRARALRRKVPLAATATASAG